MLLSFTYFSCRLEPARCSSSGLSRNGAYVLCEFWDEEDSVFLTGIWDFAVKLPRGPGVFFVDCFGLPITLSICEGYPGSLFLLGSVCCVFLDMCLLRLSVQID